MIDAPLSGHARNHQQDALHYALAHLPKHGRNQNRPTLPICQKVKGNDSTLLGWLSTKPGKFRGADQEGGPAFRRASGPLKVNKEIKVTTLRERMNNIWANR